MSATSLPQHIGPRAWRHPTRQILTPTVHLTTILLFSMTLPFSPFSPLPSHSTTLHPFLPTPPCYFIPTNPFYPPLVSQSNLQLGLAGCVGGHVSHSTAHPSCGDMVCRPNATSLAGAAPTKVSPKGGINPRKVHHKKGAPQGQCHPQVGVTPRRASLSGTCFPRRVPLQAGAPQRECTIRRVQPKQGASQGECHS